MVGFIVNKMRGDLSLFDAGMADIARRTGWRPWAWSRISRLHGCCRRKTPTTSANRRATKKGPKSAATGARIAVPHLPRIANFDDLDPFHAEPNVDLVLVEPGSPVPMNCDFVILPGSKATIADLDALRREGWDIDLMAHHRRGGSILGLCGGYQMLGKSIADPDGVEDLPEPQRDWACWMSRPFSMAPNRSPT